MRDYEADIERTGPIAEEIGPKYWPHLAGLPEADRLSGNWPGREPGNRARRRAKQAAARKQRTRRGQLEDLVQRMRASNKRLREQLADTQPAA
jgi:hypothetical protein